MKQKTPAGSTPVHTPDAFEAACIGAHHEIRAAVFSILRDWHESEDLTQQAMETALRSRSDYDPARGNVGRWLRTIAVNDALDRRRTVRRVAVADGALVAHRLERTLPAGEMSEPQWSDRRLVAELRRLADDDLTLLVGRHVLDYTSAQLAPALDKSPEALRQADSRTRRRLRRRLTAQGFGQSGSDTRVERNPMLIRARFSPIAEARRAHAYI